MDLSNVFALALEHIIFITTSVVVLACLVAFIIWRLRRKEKSNQEALETVAEPEELTRSVVDASGKRQVEKWLRGEIRLYEKKIDEKLALLQIGGKKSTGESRSNIKWDYRPVQVYPWLYWLITLTVIAVIGLYMWSTVLFAGTFTAAGYEFARWPLTWLPAVLYLLLSIRIIKNDEIGGALFLDLPVAEFSNGPTLVLRGIFAFVRESAVPINAEFPGDKDRVSYIDEKEELPPGKVRAMRALFSENTEGTLPTDREMFAAVTGLIVVKMTKEMLFRFLRYTQPIDPVQKVQVLETLRTNQATSDRILEFLRAATDLWIKVVKEIAGQMSVGETNRHLGLVNKLILLRLQYESMQFGVPVINAGLTNINTGHSFSEAMQTRGRADAERDARIAVAEGERVEIEKRGQGTAAARQALLEAEATGQKAVAEALGVTGAEVLAAQTAQSFGNSGNAIIATDGIAGILAMVRKATEERK